MDILDLIKEGKVKRFFQTRNKLAFEGAIYHITQRAPGKEPLFIEEADYLYMLHLIKESVEKFNYDIFSFILMTNHLHLLIRLSKANLSSAMKNLFETYAKYFNKKYERKGPVFCKPYRAALCLDYTYLLAASIYIHLNPLKAGLVKNPSNYRWSSYSLYSKDRDADTFLNYRFILGILNEDIKDARLLYRSLINKTKTVKTGDVLEDSKALEVFQSKVFKLVKQVFPEESIKKISGADILNSEVLERKIGELTNRKRLRKPHDMQARKFLIEQLISRGYKITEIAQRLNISCRSVYNTLNFTL